MKLVIFTVAGLMLVSLSCTGHCLSVQEKQVTEPPTEPAMCTDAGNPRTAQWESAMQSSNQEWRLPVQATAANSWSS